VLFLKTASRKRRKIDENAISRPAAEEFEAEIVIDHPESVLVLCTETQRHRRIYSVADCFGLSGVPSKWKKYDIMRERLRARAVLKRSASCSSESAGHSFSVDCHTQP